MSHKELYHFKTISEYHRALELSNPEHPLISLIDYREITRPVMTTSVNLMGDFYGISIKKNFEHKFNYGQQQYDFDNGVMFFGAPKQVFGIEANPNSALKVEGWMLLIHPDFFWNTPMASQIRQYDFFSYSANEALFLSEKEEDILNQIVQNIKREYQANLDKFSKQIIITQIESLLSYAERFYHRQFITREKSNHQILNRLEVLLEEYFGDEEKFKNGLPTVQFISESLHTSPSYLRTLLKSLTGLTTQEHIHEKLIERAKEKLSTTGLSVSEIAYELGFGHAQSFSKLFKSKTKFSPLEFRASFN